MDKIVVFLDILSVVVLIISIVRIIFIMRAYKDPDVLSLIILSESIGEDPVGDIIKETCIGICLSVIWLLARTLN